MQQQLEAMDYEFKQMRFHFKALMEQNEATLVSTVSANTGNDTTTALWLLPFNHLNQLLLAPHISHCPRLRSWYRFRTTTASLFRWFW